MIVTLCETRSEMSPERCGELNTRVSQCGYEWHLHHGKGKGKDVARFCNERDTISNHMLSEFRHPNHSLQVCPVCSLPAARHLGSPRQLISDHGAADEEAGYARARALCTPPLLLPTSVKVDKLSTISKMV